MFMPYFPLANMETPNLTEVITTRHFHDNELTAG